MHETVEQLTDQRNDLLAAALHSAMRAMAEADSKAAAVRAIRSLEMTLGQLQRQLHLEVSVGPPETGLGLVSAERLVSRGAKKGCLQQRCRMVLFQDVAAVDEDLGELVSQALTGFDDLYGDRWSGLPDDLEEAAEAEAQAALADDDATQADDDAAPAEVDQVEVVDEQTTSKLETTRTPQRRLSAVKRNAERNHPELKWWEACGEEWGERSQGLPVGAMESWHDALDAFLPIVQAEWGLSDTWMRSGRGSKMLHVNVTYSEKAGMKFNLAAIHYREDGGALNMPANSLVGTAIMQKLWFELERETLAYLDGASAQLDMFDADWEENRHQVGFEAYEAACQAADGAGTGAPGPLFEDVEVFEDVDAQAEAAAVDAAEAEAAEDAVATAEAEEDAELAAAEEAVEAEAIAGA